MVVSKKDFTVLISGSFAAALQWTEGVKWLAPVAWIVFGVSVIGWFWLHLSELNARQYTHDESLDSAFEIRDVGDDLRETGFATGCGDYINRKLAVTNTSDKPRTGIQLRLASIKPSVENMTSRLPVALWPQRENMPHPEHKFDLAQGESKIVGVFGTCTEHPNDFKLWHMEGYAFPAFFPRGDYRIGLEIRADGIDLITRQARLWIEKNCEPKITVITR